MFNLLMFKYQICIKYEKHTTAKIILRRITSFIKAASARFQSRLRNTIVITRGTNVTVCCFNRGELTLKINRPRRVSRNFRQNFCQRRATFVLSLITLARLLLFYVSRMYKTLRNKINEDLVD